MISMSTQNTHRIQSVIREVLKERAPTEVIPAEEDLTQLGLSSLAMVNLMLGIEAEFDVTIPGSKLAPKYFKSVAAIDALVSELTR